MHVLCGLLCIINTFDMMQNDAMHLFGNGAMKLHTCDCGNHILFKNNARLLAF